MELGCDGVLINSAIAQAKKPIIMARLLKMQYLGRNSYLAGGWVKIILQQQVLQVKG